MFILLTQNIIKKRLQTKGTKYSLISPQLQTKLSSTLVLFLEAFFIRQKFSSGSKFTQNQVPVFLHVDLG